MKKKITFLILFICMIVLIADNVKSQNNDIAMHGNSLPDINVNVSAIQNNQHTVNVTQQMANIGYNPAPDNYYYGHLIITNDTNQVRKIKKIDVAGMVQAVDGINVNEYEIVLNEWFTYSFNINNGQELISDTPINKFTNATLTTDGNRLHSEGGYAQLNDYIFISPQATMDLYYDFSFHWQATNITRQMSFSLQYAVNFESVNTYKIETKVINGVIDNTIDNIEEGSNHTINYHADKGYVLKSIIVDGVQIPIADYLKSYTFKNITKDYVIEVIYSKYSNSNNEDTNKDNQKKENVTKDKLPDTGSWYFIEAVLFIGIICTLIGISKLRRII